MPVTMPQKGTSRGSQGPHPGVPPRGKAGGGPQGPKAERTSLRSFPGLDPTVCLGPERSRKSVGCWEPHWCRERSTGLGVQQPAGLPALPRSHVSLDGLLCSSRASAGSSMNEVLRGQVVQAPSQP